MGPPGGRGPSRGYAVLNGAGATRSWGISSPCCSRFERRVLSLAHALVGTVVCASAGVLPKYWNTWLGHIGPAGVMFIISELERFPGPNTVVTQGWTCVIGGMLYIMYDLIIHGCHLNIHCTSLREQQHIAINALLVVVGFDMVFQRSRFSASLIGFGFCLFVGLHPQPNNMGILMHRACACALILRFDVCSKALYYASYLFFYGQNGFMELFDKKIDDTAYVLYIICLATLMSTLTELIDYAFLEGLPRAWNGGAGLGLFSPGSPSKGSADGRGSGEEFEMIRLTDDFEAMATQSMSRGD